MTESAEAMTKIPGAESSKKRELHLTGIEKNKNPVWQEKITDIRTQGITKGGSNQDHDSNKRIEETLDESVTPPF